MTEEQTGTTTPKPDMETFDISEWLETGQSGRATETITVYKDPTMLDKARKLAAKAQQINAEAEAGEGEDLAMGEASESTQVQAELDELERKITASKAVVEIKALSDGEVEDIAATFRQRYPGEKKDWDRTIKGTCLLLAEAATINGQRFSADQWRQLSEGPLAGGQWQRIKQAHLVAQNKTPRADIPFS